MCHTSRAHQEHKNESKATCKVSLEPSHHVVYLCEAADGNFNVLRSSCDSCRYNYIFFRPEKLPIFTATPGQADFFSKVTFSRFGISLRCAFQRYIWGANTLRFQVLASPAIRDLSYRFNRYGTNPRKILICSSKPVSYTHLRAHETLS
jgi:hypothetical protein